MEYNYPVDFETYYFVQLLEGIKKLAKTRIDDSLLGSLNKFVDFLFMGDLPLENIEKLARIQGTSDISIFFSDLMERIREYSPETALNKIKDYAHDFLEIYNELSRDSQWQQHVLRELLGSAPVPADEYSFMEITQNEISQYIDREFETNFPELTPQIEDFLKQLSASEKISEKFARYENVDVLQPAINLITALYERQGKDFSVEKYFSRFLGHLDGLTREFLKLAKDSPEIFLAFLAGEPVAVEEKPVVKKDELEEMIESARKFDENAAARPKLSEEDIQLRLLLRDYITHEINELTKELGQNLNALQSKPGDKENRKVILENMKVYKDLGQIHKYPGIEKISSELLAAIQKHFTGQNSLSQIASDALLDAVRFYTSYIDLVLEDKEQQGIDTLTKKKDAVLLALQAEEPLAEVFSLKDGDVLPLAFQPVNYLLLVSAEDAYREFLTKPEDNRPLGTIAGKIEHVKNWYEILGLEGPGKIADQILRWVAVPELNERLIGKQDVITDAFAMLSSQLFQADKNAWGDLLNRLSEEAPVEEEGVAIHGSLEAFQDVALRHLRQIEKALKDESISFAGVVENYYLPNFKRISGNSGLFENHQISELCTYFINQNNRFRDVPEAILQKFRTALAEKLEMVAQAVFQLPEEIPIPDLIAECDEMYEECMANVPPAPQELTHEPTDEDVAAKREDYIDDELKGVFYKEAKKYLAEIEKYLNDLDQNLDNRKSLEKLGGVTHTLKGSAQMLNRNEIADLARPLENIVDLIIEGELELAEELIPTYRKTVDGISAYLENKDANAEEITLMLNSYIDRHLRSKTDEKVPQEIAEDASAPDILKEVAGEEMSTEEEAAEPLPEEEMGAVPTKEPVLKLSEKDPELLEIFKSEALNNLETIDKNLALIEKFTHDKQTVQTLDQAIHEVRAAAKMLGFAEIGHLMDNMEQVIEEVGRNEPADWNQIVPAMRKVIQVVRSLTEKFEVAQQEYDETARAITATLEQLKLGEGPKAREKKPTSPPDIVEEERVLEPSEQVMEAFIQEARDYLEDINFLLMKMEKNPDNEEMAYHLMRSLHTLKGSAAMVYQEAAEKLTHLGEDIVEGYHDKGEALPQKAIDLLFEVVDEVEFIVDALDNGLQGKTKNFENVAARLEAFYQNLAGGTGVEAATPEEETKEPITPPKPAEKPAKIVPEPTDEEYLSITEELETGKTAPRDAYVRLHVNQMDTLLNEAAELVINHTQFKTQFDKFKNYLPRMDMEGKNLQNILWYLDTIVNEERRIGELVKPYVQNMPAVEESQKKQIENIQRAIHNLQVFYGNFKQSLQGIKESGKLYEEQVHKITNLSAMIHEQIMEARLVPIALLFQRFNRPLRDLAKKHNKKIKLYLEGESTELDRLLIEELYEPMLHILRNAIDHGIEPPNKRKKAGKAEEGLIKIIAKQERNFVNVEVHDDGAGIDMGKVKARAIELGFLEKDQAAALGEQEILEFLTTPGFSTAETTTELSGRGVGLDVVKNAIQKIKGDLRIYSEIGKGTRFVIRVPISLTVTQAMLVDVGAQIYAMPLLQVEETTNITIRDLDLRESVYFMRHRGNHIPVLYLTNLLQIRTTRRKPVSVVGEYPVIIVQDEGIKVALLVDKIVHREEILIKTLGPSLRRVRFITGGSVLADGKVVLVLDIPQIVREAVRMKETGAALHPQDLMRPDTERPTEELAAAKSRRVQRIIKDRKPAVLVVDDSLSIRKFLAGLLTQKDYEVEMAKNGYQALEKLNQREFDLVVTDLEMPHLSGYELIEQVRADARWDSMPIIVLTGRASKHIQQLTQNLGADEFIIKPFKENELIDKIETYIGRE